MTRKQAKMILPATLLSAAALSFITAPAGAFSLWGPSKPLPVYTLSIQGRHFIPDTLSVPAGTKFKLVVSNKNAKPSEFESFSLHREQVVTPGSKTTVFLGPLAPGRYGFFDDFQTGVTGALKAAAKPAPAVSAKKP